ncbi:MAG: hypothetical protein AABX30_03315 [Nanoarchaeota archaeon]
MRLLFNIKKPEHLETIFQIILLIISTFAFAYIIHEADKNISIVSAETTPTGAGDSLVCCPETKSGAICQDILSSATNTCKVDTIPMKCEEFSNCELGCCIDEEEGLCNERATKQKCLADGGTWEDDENCNMQNGGCENVCCILGDETVFVTDKRCEKLASLYGFQKYSEQVGTEVDCILKARTQEKGACAIGNEEDEEKNCKFTTKAECLSMNGNFNKDYLCSNEELKSLGVDCEKQKSINCIEGRDEIYWFDSCGNQENIYSSDKTASWNNGKILTKEQSCNSNNANVNSKTCGNCNYLLGSKCSVSFGIGSEKVNDGNYICRDTNCVDPDTKEKRRNGESWCVYDSYIGDGKDTVGSRHWKKFCIDGEVKTEACADYRGQICIQSDTEIPESKEKFSQAVCKTNRAIECLSYNNQENSETKLDMCRKNPDCLVKRIDIDSGFKFDVCVGKYPMGFDLSTDRGQTGGSQICSMASQKCIAVYKKNLSGKWKCKVNCDCVKKVFTEQMNDLCVSLGDCGTYVNYVGEGTDNIVVKKAPQISWQDYKKYATPVKGQIASAGNISELLESLGIETYGYADKQALQNSGLAKLGGTVQMAGGIIGMTGGLMMMLPQSVLYTAGATLLPSASGGIVAGSVAATQGAATAAANAGGLTTLGGIANAAATIGVGVAVAGILSYAFGLQGEAATIMTVAGAASGIAYFFMEGFHLTITFVYFLIALVVIAIVLKILGIGKTKKVTVEFQCLPWQAPIGGKDCTKCNDNPLKPCSKYRCQSLGSACEIVNENSLNPICVDSNPNDVTPPKISAGGTLDEYKFQNERENKIELRTSDGGCIREFTPVTFNLNTDEYAQCKFDFTHTAKYNDMSDFAAEGTLFTKNHTLGVMIPSIESMEIFNVTGDLRQMFGELNMYVRCQDTHGNFNLNEYVVDVCLKSGPDTTPPLITGTSPVNGAYVKYGSSSINMNVYLNEPAECKYSTSDKGYNEMENPMICDVDLEDMGSRGWTCNTTLNNLAAGENNFYFKCKDKPWLGIDKDSERNINQQSYNYKLILTQSELKIDSVAPKGDLIRGSEPITLNLEVKTSGGAESGKAKCYYNFREYNKLYEFKDTGTNIHKQVFDQMTRGEKTIFLLCEDSAGNIVQNQTIINLIVDTTPPKVVRVFNDGVDLKVITDEQAECYYRLDRCEFNLENGTKMTSAFSTEHSADLTIGNTYYIRCRDIFGNTESGCSIRALPSLA